VVEVSFLSIYILFYLFLLFSKVIVINLSENSTSDSRNFPILDGNNTEKKKGDTQSKNLDWSW